MRGQLSEQRGRLADLGERLLAASPLPRIQQAKGHLEARMGALGAASERGRMRQAAHLGTQAGRLDALSPLKVLHRGYSITFSGAKVVRSHDQLRTGEPVRVLLPDQGELDATVTAVRPPRKP